MSRTNIIFPPGKLSASYLRRLLDNYVDKTVVRQARLVVGPGIGLDAAAIDFHSKADHYLIAKTDPITFVSEEIGLYALTINANDLATMGAIPRWFLATLLFPPGTPARDITRVFSQLGAVCRAMEVALCGGHTEITDAVTRPVIVGCLLGECPKHRLVTTAGARVGDAILLTKGIPIEAVSILARERQDALAKRFSSRFLARCKRFLHRPGISVVRDAQLALAGGGVHAMHDPTEGGLSTALYEIAEAARVGIEVDESAIPVLPEGLEICRYFGIDPMGAIASGALLICADPRRTRRIQLTLTEHGIAAACIGQVVPRQKGVRLRTSSGTVKALPRFARDEIARVLE